MQLLHKKLLINYNCFFVSQNNNIMHDLKLNLIKFRKFIFILSSFFILLIYLCFKYSYLIDDELLKTLSTIGNIVTVFGFFIMIFQISNAISIAQASKNVAETTREKINSYLSIVDIAKLHKTIQEIQRYNRNKEFSLSLIKMQEVREGLQAINCNVSFEQMVDKTKIINHIANLAIDMSSIERHLILKTKEINQILLNKNLDSILEDIGSLMSEIRFNGDL